MPTTAKPKNRKRATETELRRERGDLLEEIVRRLSFKHRLPRNRIHHHLALDVWKMADARAAALKAGRNPPRVDPDIKELLIRYVDLDVVIEKPEWAFHG